MGVLDLFKTIGENNKKRKDKVEYTEEELEVYGLTEKEKELVRKGLYNPWDFEENHELNDDDYYNEK